MSANGDSSLFDDSVIEKYTQPRNLIIMVVAEEGGAEIRKTIRVMLLKKHTPHSTLQLKKAKNK